MVDLIRQILTYLVNNYALYLVITMGVIVSITIGILTLIKKPIKKLTRKISDERLRKLANKMFIAFAFLFSLIIWWLLNVCAPTYFAVDGIQVLLTGAFSIVIYALGDGVITKSSAQKIIESITDVAEDNKETASNGKTEEKPQSAIKEYLKKVK
jgi:dolichyl-phosphate-mannose--protein O-mannosyl transferase